MFQKTFLKFYISLYLKYRYVNFCHGWKHYNVECSENLLLKEGDSLYDLVKKDIIINKSINTTAAAVIQIIALFSPTRRVGLYISGWFDCISPFNTILSQRS